MYFMFKGKRKNSLWDLGMPSKLDLLDIRDEFLCAFATIQSRFEMASSQYSIGFDQKYLPINI